VGEIINPPKKRYWFDGEHAWMAILASLGNAVAIGLLFSPKRYYISRLF